MKIADYIANQLYNKGIRYVFGIPGGPSIPYMESFKKEGIAFILTSNEAAAGIMADVTARLTGIPGICHATFGPGATNISTGIGGALLDRSSVIVLTSEMDDSMTGRTSQMNIDHQKLFEPVTKATFRLNRQNVPDVIANAFSICRSEYPGPVHIGLPAGLADLDIEPSAQELTPEVEKLFKNDITRLTSILDSSRRPLLAVGLTAQRLGITEQLLSFLNRYRIPVVLTPMAKGMIPESHPSYAGVLFHALSDYLEDIYTKTDLVIGLGYDPVEYNYESWMPDVPLVHLGTIETDLPDHGDVTRFVGQPDEWFRLLGNLNAGSLIFERSVVAGIRNEMNSVFEGFTGHFGPVKALKILRDELPSGAIITSDVGSHLHLLGQLWETGGKPDLIMTNGWSGMGFGLPAALAAQLNHPEKSVVCITGDGGFLMMAGEIITARRYNLPVIVVVLSDGELNLIKLKQSWKDLQPYGTVMYHGDLFCADTFFGISVITATTESEMQKAVNQALALNEPVIINAVIDPDDYKWLVVRK